MSSEDNQIKKNHVDALKDIIIESVAQDVLILTDNVEKLKEGITDLQALFSQIETSAIGHYDNLSKNVIELLDEQEKALAKIAEERTNQVKLNVADNIEKILNKKFDEYQVKINEALANFDKVNKQAVDELGKNWTEANDAIKTFKNTEQKPVVAANKNVGAKLVYAAIGLQLVTLAAVAVSFIF